MRIFDKLWPFWVLLFALSCPACFPALAWLSSVLGLTYLQTFEKEIFFAIPVFILLSLIFAIFTYLKNKYIVTLILNLLSWGVLLFTWFVIYNSIAFYIGMMWLIIASVWNVIIDRKLPSCKDWICDTNFENK